MWKIDSEVAGEMGLRGGGNQVIVKMHNVHHISHRRCLYIMLADFTILICFVFGCKRRVTIYETMFCSNNRGGLDNDEMESNTIT